MTSQEIIDLVKMKATNLYLTTLGTDISEEDISAEHLEQTQEYREKLVKQLLWWRLDDEALKGKSTNSWKQYP